MRLFAAIYFAALLVVSSHAGSPKSLFDVGSLADGVTMVWQHSLLPSFVTSNIYLQVEMEVAGLTSTAKTGTVKIKLHRDWAPLGYDQFLYVLCHND